jgi:hypothetical protein
VALDVDLELGVEPDGDVVAPARIDEAPVPLVPGVVQERVGLAQRRRLQIDRPDRRARLRAHRTSARSHT